MTRSRNANAVATNQSRSVAAGTGLPTAKVSFASTVEANSRTSSSLGGVSGMDRSSSIPDMSCLLKLDDIKNSTRKNFIWRELGRATVSATHLYTVILPIRACATAVTSVKPIRHHHCLTMASQHGHG